MDLISRERKQTGRGGTLMYETKRAGQSLVDRFTGQLVERQ